MTSRFLLDTDMLSQLIRAPQGAVARRLVAAGEGNVFTSAVVACELRYGARRTGSPGLIERVEQLLASLEVAALEPGVDRVYVEIRCALESEGRPIGANDLLIAAHALEQEAVLVSGNVGEFRRVKGLEVQDWLGAAV
jgi:tRNA(fMet)-specific endonuclease VapC